ncbi:Alpha/Beta hydrolase protein [Hypoxylon trugodes]|uniref:Alpha/Beta hydrolase protein n=1 Tax=Hypoxylon trugodes TaxID=326681 RepID=UPI00218CB566|nr:Alpha/Beta hydrolase protein [Hypoxylon trugodes]KAI1385698.1 Alpha/Beta hydrolase protein [Hypoxylon trugodes]
MKTNAKTYLLSILYLTHQVAAAYPTAPGNSTSFKIDWKSCGDDVPSGADCGQIEVPLDWSQPQGQQITLGIMRIKATNASTRLGSLIYNPGGPGGAATAFCGYQLQGKPIFGEALTSHFDIICPDPRGIGTSSPISCDPDLWNQRQTLFPEDSASFQQMIEHNRAFGQSCLDRSGDIVKHVDTISVARDMEAIRIALNDGKLNWLGISYGTMIGAQYAELFPENIRVMALDGNVDHSAPEIYTTMGEALTYEDELNRFFNWCTKNETCALHGQDVARLYDELVQQADSTPIPAPGCEPRVCFPNVTDEDIRFNIQGKGLLTYKKDIPIALGWGRLGARLNEAINGNATFLSSSMAESENSAIWQGLAVGCLDWNHDTATFEDYMYRRYLANATTPRTLGASQSYMYNVQCLGWPAPMRNPQRALNQSSMRLAPPILMVNSEHDPESSYLWAQGLRSQIPSAVFLTRRGDGHSSYNNVGEATRLIEAYLINGTLPEQNVMVES